MAATSRLSLRCSPFMRKDVIHNRLVQKRWHASSDKKSPTKDASVITMMQPKTFLIGSVAGTLGSLAGMGGGFVMIPLMTGFLRFSQHQAHGTSLFAVAATGVAGAMGYSGEVQLEAAVAIACCGMVTARLGAMATKTMSEQTLKKALGVFMLAVAPLVPAKAYLTQQTTTSEKNDSDENASQDDKKDISKAQKWLIPALIGCGSGYMAGVFGVGGGAIVVPALTVATDMTHYQALGTSLCAMSLPAIVGTATHYSQGNVVIRAAPTLAMGAFAGAYLGSKYVGLNTDEMTLRWGFSGLMAVLGLKTLLR